MAVWVLQRYAMMQSSHTHATSETGCSSHPLQFRRLGCPMQTRHSAACAAFQVSVTGTSSPVALAAACSHTCVTDHLL